ncbi:MAG TPA: choice-of-anchor V domain-containing protein [Longimicrobiaceae bacterium]|nr:choice-of-anchor V domain-containing protein [Longimicrobiaceae bacterium]
MKITLVLTSGLVAGSLAVLCSPVLAAYLDGPPPAHTGGFGEPTCGACHFGSDLNDGEGVLAIAGVPGTYTPGQRYLLTITLGRAAMERGGFELSARFADGDNAGAQAGALSSRGERVEITSDGEPAVEYAHHTEAGVALAAPDTARWKLEWTAPEDGGAVVFHVAANAANGDDSEFGDHIYTAQAEVSGPSQPAGAARSGRTDGSRRPAASSGDRSR